MHNFNLFTIRHWCSDTLALPNSSVETPPSLPNSSVEAPPSLPNSGVKTLQLCSTVLDMTGVSMFNATVRHDW